MQNAEPNTPEGERKLLDHVLAATIPMRGRMIHGRKANGELYEESQDYDVHGRVSTLLGGNLLELEPDTAARQSSP